MTDWPGFDRRAPEWSIDRIARLEERLGADERNMVRIEAHMAALDRRLNNVESSSSRSGWVVSGLERLAWLAATVAATFFGQKL